MSLRGDSTDAPGPQDRGEASTVVVRAPAKLNLSLAVLGKRADGYHEVATHMIAIGLYDELTLRMEPHKGSLSRVPRVVFRLDSDDPEVPRDGTNLAVRALALVHERALEGGFRTDVRYELELKKRIPSGAGLGGGSSDAAAAAYAAARLCGVDPDDRELLRRLGRLGSDVPFFLHARASGFALCTGRGEQVEPLPPLRGLHFAVVSPDLHVRTADVYRALKIPAGGRAAFDLTGFLEGSIEERRARLRNDLEGSALRLAAPLSDWAKLLRDAPGGPWRLSGSGSSFFALFADAAAAQAAIRVVRAQAFARDFSRNFECVLCSADGGLQPVVSKSHLDPE
jgi:4-diphosphocytidyl-2-C-methyl-D-erythritol kinase